MIDWIKKILIYLITLIVISVIAFIIGYIIANFYFLMISVGG